MRFGKTESQALIGAPEWMAEFADGELMRFQRARLADWLRDSPRHVRELVELTLLGKDLNALPLSREQIDAWVREARETGADAISISSSSSIATSAPRKPWFRGMAASIAVALLAIGAYAWWQDGRYATHFGEQRIITLSDGSVVTLNTSSALTVDFSRDTRALRLARGEAFFRVARDAARPFVVIAQDAAVKALGTQFNVRIGQESTVISVLDGAVEVRDRPAAQNVAGSAAPEPVLRLEKGEEARVDSRGLVKPRQAPAAVKPDSAAVLRAAAWTRGRVEFENEPLIAVLGEFQRYRQFDVAVDEPLRDLKLTGSFDAQDPESALAYIATLPGVVVEKPSAHAFRIRKK